MAGGGGGGGGGEARVSEFFFTTKPNLKTRSPRRAVSHGGWVGGWGQGTGATSTSAMGKVLV